jgi:glyoxylase-like metal-dependent hydrolase (beta-lactamase superfamily II)
LEKLLARDEHTYWPTHGGPITDPARHVAAFIAHRQERAAHILSCVDDGQQTLQAMVPVIYQGLDERLFPAAARSTFASIVYLVEQGQLVASEGLSMEASFSRTG